MNMIDRVKGELPEDSMISEICFEGSEITVYTKNRELFLEREELIKDIARKLKKRINLRPDQSITKDLEYAENKIKELVPDEADIKHVNFEADFGKVIIEAKKPGLVIGKKGETFKKIKEKTLWFPVVKRAPAIDNDIVKTIRKVMINETKFRKDFLNKIGKRIYKDNPKEVEWIRTTSLGGFREVGRSCILVQTPESKVLMDCGIKPGGNDGFPYLDVPEFDINKLDAIVITHPHLDHLGFVPYLYEYGFKGPLYCTPPTRDLLVLLCKDYIDVAQREGFTSPYSTKGIEKAIKNSVVLEYDEVSDITPDIRLTFQNSGHILGSAMAHFHIGEGLHNIVYTGDFNFDKSQLFEPASLNFQRVETLITESTYGGKNDTQPSRREAEELLLDEVKTTLKKGGKVLIPSFAVGRAQEIMSILARDEEFNYPVYLEGMLWDATAIHTTYPEYLNKTLQNLIFHKERNPFTSDIFKRVGSSQERNEILASEEPSVIISTSGMLVGGPVMEYLKELAHSEKNTLLFVGYQAEGTLGRRIQKGWREVPIDKNGRKNVLDMKMRIATVEGLSGHSDRNQLINYVYKLNKRFERIIVNHGDNKKTLDLASSLHKLFRCETLSPKNLETVRLK